ncbi:enterobactin exporter EntS [Abditibacteriota bacterium]|nr:enterobactin exporter EntS [Abditibacteriota bacterium]
MLVEYPLPDLPPPPHDRLAVLRLPDFRRYLIGGALAAAGGQMTGVAAGWELYERTNMPIALGLLGLMGALPVIALALPAGTVADRFNRKTVCLWAELCASLSLALLACVSYFRLPLTCFYFLFLLLGVCGAFLGPALGALVANIVGDVLLADATKWSSIRWQLASTLGPVLGGFLIHRYGAFLIYALDAIGRLVFCVLLIGTSPKPHERSGEKLNWGQVAAGWHFVRGNPLIISTITLDMVAVLFGGATAMLPIYAHDILKVGAEGLGPLRAAPAVGAIFMSIYLTSRPPFTNAGRSLLFAVGGFGLATIIFGVSHLYWLSLMALAALGALDSISVVIRHTILQVLTPDEMRGRVNAVNSVFIGTSNEIGELESGVVAQLLGPIFTVAGGGAITILIVVFVAMQWPVVRRIKRLEDLRVVVDNQVDLTQ